MKASVKLIQGKATFWNLITVPITYQQSLICDVHGLHFDDHFSSMIPNRIGGQYTTAMDTMEKVAKEHNV